jgi:hypothetical protein
MYVYAVARRIAEIEVFGDAFLSRTATEEAIKTDMDEDNAPCDRNDYEIPELRVV